MDPALKELIEAGDADDEVRVVARIAPDAAAPEGVEVVSRFGDVATWCLRRGDLERAWEASQTITLKAARLVEQDPAVGWHDPGPPGAGGPTSDDERRLPGLRETGQGVIVACLDWGVDFAHPDFRTPAGGTRLLAIWDQRPESRKGTTPRYGYGVVHDRRAIDAALATRDPYGTLGYHHADADLGHGCHGTHCLSIAAGTGSAATPSGMAPRADLLFVHLDTPRAGSGKSLGDWATLLDALDFCLAVAGARPIVISMSLGSEGGPHDGTTPLERALDFAVSAAPGRAICQSTGNYYEARTHSSGRLRPGDRERIGWITSRAQAIPHELEVWYAGADRIVARIESREHALSVVVSPGESRTLELDGVIVGRIHHRIAEPNNRKNHINAFLYPGAPGGRWDVVLEATDVADGRYHCWVERESGSPGAQSHLDETEIDKRYTTNSVCNGLRTITVGGYDARSPARPPAPFSSLGPTSDGRIKPDIGAPAVQILAARSTPRGEEPGDRATTMSGTSMAAPYVAGVIALMFEAARRPMAIAETRRHLSLTAEAADFAGDDEFRLGDGYIDVERAVAAARGIGGELTEEEPDMTPISTTNGATASADRMLDRLGLSPAALFDALRGSTERPDLEVSVLAGPGSKLTVEPRACDIVLSRVRGERDRGRMSVLHDGTVHDREQCRALGHVLHDAGRGLYVHVTGAGGEIVAIRIADTGSRLSQQHMLIRPIGAENVGESASGPGLAEVDEETLRAQWNAHRRVHDWFDGGISTYFSMAPLFANDGIADAAAYLDHNITTARLLGHQFPAHAALAAALAQANAALQGATPAPDVHSIWAINARPIRGRANSLSQHALGLAVDINPDTNPLIRASDEPDVVRVISAVTGVNLGATQTAEAMRQASLTFRATYGEEWLAARRAELDAAVQAGDSARAENLRHTLAAAGRSAGKLSHLARTGFLDLDQRLIDALRAAGLTWGGSWRTSKDFMHFELHLPAASTAAQSAESALDAPGEDWTATPAIAARRVSVAHVPMLARHQGQSPELLLGWNDMPSMPGEIDVVVHLHGFWYPNLDLRRDIAPVSGLDLAPIAGASGSGRLRPTLTVLPRGNDTGVKQQEGPYNIYTFPALVARNGLDDLVRFALDRFAAEVGGRPPGVARLILTAHSGGGRALGEILETHDPHQVHVFDALYRPAEALVKWARRRLASDRAALAAGARPEEYMPSRGGALRVFYRDRYAKGATRLNSLAVRDALASEISAELAPWYRVEASKHDHFQIPRQYGWRVLGDASADVPDAHVEPARSAEAELESVGEGLAQPVFERWDEDGLGEGLPGAGDEAFEATAASANGAGPSVAARILWPALGCPAVVAPREHPPDQGGVQHRITVLLLSDRAHLTAADVASHLRFVPWERRASRRAVGSYGTFNAEDVQVRDDAPAGTLTRPQSDARGEAVVFGGTRYEDSVCVSLAKRVREFYRANNLPHLHEITISEAATARLTDGRYHLFWEAPGAADTGPSAELAFLLGRFAAPRRRGAGDDAYWQQFHREHQDFLLDEYRYEYGALHLPYRLKDDEKRLTEVLHPVFVRRETTPLRLAHVTDTHLDTRQNVYEHNLKAAHGQMSWDGTRLSYRGRELRFGNTNQSFSEHYERAKREADVIVMTGDLIEFGRGHIGQSVINQEVNLHSLSDLGAYHTDRNWFLFYYLMASRDAYGKPVYTSLGNHDWRLNPYPPFSFGATEPEEMIHNYGVFTPEERKEIIQIAHGEGWEGFLYPAQKVGRDLFTRGLSFHTSPLETDVESVVWYLLLINPFLDYALPMPGGQQLLMLDWGKDEDVSKHTPWAFEYGTPAEANVLSPLQYWHVEQLTQSPGVAKIIGKHAPPLGPFKYWTDEDLARGEVTYSFYQARELFADLKVPIRHHTLCAIPPHDQPRRVAAVCSSMNQHRDWFIEQVARADCGVRLVLSGHIHREGLLAAVPTANGDGRLLKAVSHTDVIAIPPGRAARQPGRQASYPSPLYVNTASAGPRPNLIRAGRAEQAAPAFHVVTLGGNGIIENIRRTELAEPNHLPALVVAAPAARQPAGEYAGVA